MDAVSCAVCSILMLLVSQTFGESAGNSSSSGWDNQRKTCFESARSSSKKWTQLLARLNRLDSELNTTCCVDLSAFVSAVSSSQPKMWALSMVDSFGKPPGGLLLGGIQWPGSFSQCRRVVQEKASGTPFRGQFCWAHFSIEPKVSQLVLQGTQKEILIKSGICVPDTCTAEQLLRAGKIIADLYPTSWLQEYINVKDIVCHKDFNVWENWTDTVALLFVFFLVVLMFVATIYDLHRRRKTSQVKQEILLKDNKPEDNSSKWLLLAFSVYTNGKNLLNLDGGNPYLPAVNGLRVLSMIWIIAGHSLFMYVISWDNIKQFVATFKSLPYETVYQAVLAVDTFFYLSGFLVTYAYLNEYQRSGGKVPWLKFYFHRYWRLTPTYLLFIWIAYTALGKYIGEGPFWGTVLYQQNICKKYWWANILYINNFMPDDEQCMGHAWYLANDMQFYILSPLLLIPFTRSVRWSLLLVMLVISASAGFRGYITAAYNFPIGLDMVDTPPGSATYNFMFRTMYDKPYSRVNPYIVGMITGLFVQRRRQITIPKMLVVFGWISSITTMLAIIYGVHYGSSFGILVKVLYNAFSRTVWAICISWIIVACCSGYGGIVSRFLSLPLWNPMSRLTYCTFLCHVLVIAKTMGSVEVSTHITVFTLSMIVIANTIFAFSSAIFVSLLFESPFARLESCILRRKNKYKELSQNCKGTV